ncbi:MAG: hypothetical protein COT18_04770 [Elusimicrobia bacterium CG08_land_8_20_14_0_20_59_10]|nr:MAG: hypothetical protein COT18_04770 [Elusimicrobia bacterium CG08_land_8_20_14_0_20_59_10]
MRALPGAGPQPRLLMAVLAVFIISAAVSGWSVSRNFEGGLTHEFCQYSEIGRNIRAGEGLRSRMIYSSALATLDERGIPFEEYNPVLDRFPLPAWLTAAAQALFGETDAAALILSVLALAALAAGTAYIAGLLLGPGAALAAGLIVALCPTLQRGFILWGLPDLGFAAITLAAIGLLISLRRNPAPGIYWAIAGIAGGLAWLYRSNFMLWLPLLALWIYKRGGPADGGRARNRLLWWTGGFLLAAAPGLANNLHWYGSINPPTMPWNLAHHVITETPPWLHYRVFTPGETLHQPLLLAGKWFTLLWQHLKSWPALWQFHLVWPAAAWGAARLWRKRREESAAFEGAAVYLAMLALQVCVFCFLRFEELGPLAGGRYYLWFIPAAAILAVRGAGDLKLLPRGIYFAAVLAFAAWWLVSPQGKTAYPGGLPVKDWPELREAALAAGEHGLVATNLPGQVVWYARRRSLHLPSYPADLEAIMRKHKVDAVLLTRLPLGEPECLPGWRAIATDPKALKEFSLKNGFTRYKDLGTSVLLAR